MSANRVPRSCKSPRLQEEPEELQSSTLERRGAEMAVSGAARWGHVAPSGEHPRTRVGSRFGTGSKRRLLVRTVQPWGCHLQDAAVLKASKGKRDRFTAKRPTGGLLNT